MKDNSLSNQSISRQHNFDIGRTPSPISSFSRVVLLLRFLHFHVIVFSGERVSVIWPDFFVEYQVRWQGQHLKSRSGRFISSTSFFCSTKAIRTFISSKNVALILEHDASVFLVRMLLHQVIPVRNFHQPVSCPINRWLGGWWLISIYYYDC